MAAENETPFTTLLRADSEHALPRDLLLFPDDTSPQSMLVDSAPAMAISQGPTNRSRTKHIAKLTSL
jgi:hypothetical protein